MDNKDIKESIVAGGNVENSVNVVNSRVNTNSIDAHNSEVNSSVIIGDNNQVKVKNRFVRIQWPSFVIGLISGVISSLIATWIYNYLMK